MSVYVPEPIDISDLKTLIDDNWDARANGEIPQPEVAISDVARFDPSKQWDMNRSAFINVYAQEIQDSQDGYAYEHVRVRATVIMDVWTMRTVAAVGPINRQYLHDVKQELRRILYSNKHSLANWQIMKYAGFEEVYEDSVAGRFHGRIRLLLENDGIRVPTELVAEDLFDRDDGAIGADWTEESGTWEVLEGQAGLQSATPGAVALFTPRAFKRNQRIQVDMAAAEDMEAGLAFRYVDADNFWRIVLIEDGGVRTVELVRTVDGVDVVKGAVLADAVLPAWLPGRTVELVVDLYNDCIVIQFNSMATLTVIDATHVDGVQYGLFSNEDQDTRFGPFHIFENGGAGR